MQVEDVLPGPARTARSKETCEDVACPANQEAIAVQQSWPFLSAKAA